MIGRNLITGLPRSPILDQTAQELDVVNTLDETTLYSLSLPGGLLAANRAIRVTIEGDYLNNSGATRTLVLKVKYGATTMFADTSVATTAAAGRYGFRVQLVLSGVSASVQQVHGVAELGAAAAPTTGTTGDFASDEILGHAVLSGTAAEDSTTTLTMAVTVQHATNHASLSVRRKYALTEYL